MTTPGAFFHPPEPPDHGPGALAERALFEALRLQLPEGWFVYHRLVVLDEDAGREREADFVLVHRLHGLLVLECKGRGVRRKGDGSWVRQVGCVEEPSGDPFDQARTAMHELVARLKPRVKQLQPNARHFPFVHGHAVVFPLSDLGALPLPMGVAKEQLLDSRCLADLEPRLLKVLSLFGRSGHRPEPLPEPLFRKFRRQILHPSLNLCESLGGVLRAEERLLVSLTQEQGMVLDGLLTTPRYAVEGGAGTGKTLLALTASQELARQGHRVLLLCFNKGLGDHLSFLCDSDDGPGSIDATTFHRLCFRAHLQRTGETLPVPADREAQAAFWLDEAPFLLLAAISEGKLPRYTALVVDEAQDFAEPWWDVLLELLEDKENAPLLVLGDPAQDLFCRGSKLPDLRRFELKRNLRQTKALAAVSAELGKLSTTPSPRAPEGEPPVVSEQPSPATLVRRLEALVTELRKGEVDPEQIALLCPHTKAHSSLAGVHSLAGVALTTNLADRRGKLLVSSIGAFKGLEADVIILLDLVPDDPRADRTARYVAASRARHRLYVFSKGEFIE
ncbi:MAG: AAA family ATPase [Myxococcota bacterium]|jgi:hypothetical protein|nr:AAA family ATPase [Myxococcota bacterium]